jgi:hypothetical protein
MNITPQIQLPRGDARILPFVVTEQDTGNIVDLADATIEWNLYTRTDNNEVLSLSDPDVEVSSRDDAAGEFAIKLQSTSTSELPLAVYVEYVVITDETGDRTTFEGTIDLVESTV